MKRFREYLYSLHPFLLSSIAGSLTLRATAIVNALKVFLPVIVKGE